ncbi:antibiotic biosynthesis monooxygenase [Kribbella capetownensis]|uniref:Antibiotic biosynthesis monooxygenase n=1 Tax=Kribbella capetownensis TaxID=1572659 RepID=A0A4V2M4V9_9ACTN|nr:antibiotic biosynthesis monooxygenase [Kribbella capetownensis]TCC37402.1 antibiotic biosynthesis monooxygenase [Kribbella capetownensis]
MIVRTWKGHVPRRHADGFEKHLLSTGVTESAAVPGHVGAQILWTDTADHTEFVFITYWRTWDAVRRFAGEDITAAVLYRGDEQDELTPSTKVDHHRVAFSSEPRNP